MACTKNMQHLLTGSAIQLLMVVIMTTPLLAMTTNSSSYHPHLKETFFHFLSLDDVLFTEDVLMEVSAWSQIQCSKKCMDTEECEMFTFHSSPQGPPGHCRLHSQEKTAKQSMPGAKSVAVGYMLVCGRYLKPVKKWVNYTTATQDCTDRQGHLAMLKSSEVIDCLRSFFEDKIFNRTWLGAHDKEEPGVFRWNDGTPLPDVSPLWKTYDNEPDHAKRGGDCVYTFPSMKGLLDRPCWRVHYYLCQKGSV